MNPSSSLQECPGWFGKIPSLGDFAKRRLPLNFVEPWDEWLAAELSEARFVLADTWATVYGTAPISCFSLSAGTVDAHAWHGILVPSFDRVGRQFPLTIASNQPLHVTAMLQHRWWAGLVATARRALELDCGADGVDQALALFLSDEPEPDVATPTSSAAPAAPGAGSSAWWSWSLADAPHAESSIVSGLPRGACFRGRLLGAR